MNNNEVKKYSEQTENYITQIKNYLIKKYGSIHDEWLMMLSLLADNYEEYNTMVGILKQTGYYDSTTGKKNPLITSIKDSRASIYKIVQHFGISPYADSKIRTMEEDSVDDYIDELTDGK